jgi:hypothetical protein
VGDPVCELEAARHGQHRILLNNDRTVVFR